MMGDRISIQFTDGNQKSVALFNHWGGLEFLAIVDNYMVEYRHNHDIKETFDPLDRFEPNTMMVDFIRYLVETKEIVGPVTHNYYLGKDEKDGDNSNNGNFLIDRDWKRKK